MGDCRPSSSPRRRRELRRKTGRRSTSPMICPKGWLLKRPRPRQIDSSAAKPRFDDLVDASERLKTLAARGEWGISQLVEFSR